MYTQGKTWAGTLGKLSIHHMPLLVAMWALIPGVLPLACWQLSGCAGRWAPFCVMVGVPCNCWSPLARGERCPPPPHSDVTTQTEDVPDLAKCSQGEMWPRFSDLHAGHRRRLQEAEEETQGQGRKESRHLRIDSGWMVWGVGTGGLASKDRQS